MTFARAYQNKSVFLQQEGTRPNTYNNPTTMNKPSIILTSLMLSLLTSMPANAQKHKRNHGASLTLAIGHRNTDSTKTHVVEAGIVGAADTLRGVSLQAISSGYGMVQGLQLSAINNFASHLQGVQAAAFYNVTTHPFKGLQISLGSNIAMGIRKGTQVGILANVASGSMRGLQVGGYNYADTLTGSQVGLINVALQHPHGVQVGLVNYTRDTRAKKIGLVNINPATAIDVMVFGGSTAAANMAIRFRNKSTYSIVGIGTPYLRFDGRFSGAAYYRLGQYLQLDNHWSLSGDLGFAHIESFEGNDQKRPEHLYSIQARLNADYQINRHLGAFLSMGYGNTRRYYHGLHYKDEFIVEGGLSVRWNHRQDAYTPMAETSKSSNNSQPLALWNDGRPNFWKATAEAVGINVLVHCFDRFVMNEDFAKVTFKTIGHNIKNGFVWDNDQFSTNLFAHPYHGNLYYNSARSSGLSFWQSAPYALGGSLMWEIAGEREPPAINDLMATTMGGICIGEVTHRISEIILNDSTRGFRRFLREAAATLINPMGGFNRIISGSAWRVRNDHNKYYDATKTPLDFSVSAGARYLSDDGALFRGEWNPYLNLFLEYGDPFLSDGTRPYDFFTVEATVGMSSNQPIVNRLHIVGRIWGKSYETNSEMECEVGIFQHFNYYDSKPVKDGTQLTPYRISEAAALGPGFLLRFPRVGALNRLEQRLYLSGILLGGTKSDYYNVIDRDYNMGSGFSIKTNTQMDFRNFGRFIIRANYYRIFTWKGYEGKDLEHTDPLYLNAQGDKSNAELLELSPIWEFDLHGPFSITWCTSYFIRKTRYAYHDNVDARTFETRLGLTWHI